MAQVVMIIEDNAIAREGIKTILQRHGYDVIVVDNGRDALELLMKRLKPDVILLDMLLPVLAIPTPRSCAPALRARMRDGTSTKIR
jgi:CheY-like chemotaxis protein